MVVERKLAEEGLDRRQLGREEFVKRVWDWKELYGGTIKPADDAARWPVATGAGSGSRLTQAYSRAVREVFVRLFEKGLIYRGEYMVNWCPRCRTALSDLEVVRDETQGHLWHIRYPVKDTGLYLVVATDAARDHAGGYRCRHQPRRRRATAPSTGRAWCCRSWTARSPSILDELADPKFGTGVVKVTPAHDPNDFEAGKRHNLAKIKVIGEDGVNDR